MELRVEFDKLHWLEKIDDRIKIDELVACMEMLDAFYRERQEVV